MPGQSSQPVPKALSTAFCPNWPQKNLRPGRIHASSLAVKAGPRPDVCCNLVESCYFNDVTPGYITVTTEFFRSSSLWPELGSLMVTVALLPAPFELSTYSARKKACKRAWTLASPTPFPDPNPAEDIFKSPSSFPYRRRNFSQQLLSPFPIQSVDPV